MTITSPAFVEGSAIPVKHTCEGDDISPLLDIRNIPSAALSLVLIVDDPDAPVGTWDHWVEYDIEIPAGRELQVPEGTTAAGIKGTNSWNLTGYMGPCPPAGQEHRYFFTVYALNGRLVLPEGVDSAGVRTAMEGRVVAESSLMGTYSR